MPIQTTIEFPQADIDRVFALMQRRAKELGGDIKRVVAWTGGKIAKSMSASTRVAPKRRKVYKKDGVYGVDIWSRGVKTFRPIKQSEGEIVEVKAKNGHTLYKNTKTGKIYGNAAEVDISTKEGAKNSGMVVIRKSGLAKKLWQVAAARMFSGGGLSPMRVSNAGEVKWFGPNLTINDNLNYALDAMRGGKMGVSTVMQRAADGMERQIQDSIFKKLGATA